MGEKQQAHINNLKQIQNQSITYLAPCQPMLSLEGSSLPITCAPLIRFSVCQKVTREILKPARQVAIFRRV